MNKTELLDLRVFTKGMETHIIAKSKIIGDWVLENAAKAYNDISVSEMSMRHGYIQTSSEQVPIRMTYLDVPDPRITEAMDIGNTGYGWLACNNVSNGNLTKPINLYGAGRQVNNSLFMILGLNEGFHIIQPRIIAPAIVNNFVASAKDEAKFIYKNFLQPSSRRLRIVVEDYTNG